MIDGLKPYPEYKDSNIGWLASVPSHWSLLPGKACFSEIYRSNKGMVESTVLSLSFGRIVVKPKEKLHGLVPESFETYQVIEPGDIIIRPTDLQNDWNSLRTSISPHRGIITSAYIALHPRGLMESEFCDRMLRTYDLLKVFYGLGCGLRQNLSWADFKYLPCVLPPPDEQAAIVKFLIYANGKIERAIRAKRKLIGLLSEQKQAIIHRAVTRGLDPNVKLKPSGIPWLGDVPEHWEVRRLKQIAKMESGENITSLSIEEQGQYPVYGGNGRRGFTDRFTHDGHYALIGRQGALCGNVNFADGKFWASEHAVIPTLKKGVSVFWFGVLIRTMNLRQYSQSAAQPGLSVDMIGNLGIPYPSMSEQELIAADIRTSTETLSAAIDRTEREIAFLREYRTTLTAEVVTGKLDVREAAKRLPDQADEPLPADESLDDLVDDEITEEDEA